MTIKMYLRHRTTSIDAVRAINIHFGLRSGINGETPYIKDGNWWVGGSDTGVSAKGRDGDPGATPEIKDGIWWIDGVDTGVSAMGITDYVHPDNPDVRHVTDEEKAAWNAKQQALVLASATSFLTLAGGKKYYSAEAIMVTGVEEFTNNKDCAMLTVPGNVAVAFGEAFKPVDGMDTVSGTAVQYKIYTIQMAPVSADGNIYVVSCALYG